MKPIKQIISFVLAAAMSVSLIAASGGAGVSAHSGELVYTAGGYSRQEIQLMEKIKKAAMNYETDPIDISSYDLSYEEFEDIYGSVVLNEPSLFYVSTVSAYMEYETKDHVLSFSPVYRYSQSRVKSMQKQIDDYTDRLMSGVQDEWSDVEKVLYVHDYIAANSVYYEGDNSFKGRNIYDVFVRGTAVCVGYALGFQYIMDMMDIPCICITSDTHIWNMVEIGSNWYHLDVTWDDTGLTSPNFVFHNMTLLSEYGIDNTEPAHEPWDYGMTADSNKYDSFFWQDSCSAMTYYGGYWYYTAIDGLCRYSFKTGESKLLFRMNPWQATDNKEWIISFGKVQQSGGSIYFNSPNKIYRYDAAAGKTYEVASPKLAPGYQIYDIVLDEGKLAVYSSDDFTDMDKDISYITLKRSSGSAGTSGKTDAPAVKDNGKTITVSWSENSDAEQYVIYRYDKSSKKIAKIATSADTSITFKKTDKDKNCLYAVKVRTADGLGKYSAWAAA